MNRSSIADRIEALMHAKGLNKAEISRRSGVSRVYLSDLFNGKSKEPRRSNVIKIANALGVSVEDIYGYTASQGVFTASPTSQTKHFSEEKIKAGSARKKDLKSSCIPDDALGVVSIPQYDIEAAAGTGLEVPDYQDPATIWTIPREALSGIRVTSLKNLAIITVRGESMQPDYMPGEHILIDIGDKIVTHDGAYVLWNSFGLVVKLIQLLPASSNSEPKLRIISKNTDFPPYEMNVTDVHISGRVVGKWVWK